MLAVVLSCKHVIARAQAALGRLDDSLTSHEDVVREATRRGHRWRGEGARNGLAQVLYALGRTQEAVDEFQRVRDNARALGLASAEGYSHVFGCLANVALGELDAARVSADDALAVADELGAAPLAGAAKALLAMLEVVGGDAEAALALGRDAASLDKISPSWRSVARATQALAQVTLGEAEGLDLAREVGAELPSSRDVLEAHDVAASLVLQALRRGGDDTAANAFATTLDQETESRTSKVSDLATRRAMTQALPWFEHR